MNHDYIVMAYAAVLRAACAAHDLSSVIVRFGMAASEVPAEKPRAYGLAFKFFDIGERSHDCSKRDEVVVVGTDGART